VGNLSFDSTVADVKKLFEGFGNVASAMIVMEKQKKASKSRGFGFVQMPDEQQALAAIAALNSKEFMGRLLNVNPARPKDHPAVGGALAKAKGHPAVGGAIAKAKVEAQEASELNPVRNTESIREKNKISNGVKEKRQPKVEAKAEQHSPREETEQKKAWFSPVFNKHPALKDGRVRPSGQHPALKDGRVRLSGQPGRYKGGRRSRSYMKQHGLTGMEDTKPRRRSQDNPMRWRKRGDQPKPWKKAEGESKPWEKTGGEIRTWRKSGEEPKPWKKPAGESKPWRKSKKRPRPRQSRIESRRKPGGYTR